MRTPRSFAGGSVLTALDHFHGQTTSRGGGFRVNISWQKYIAEFLGTLILVLGGSVAIRLRPSQSDFPGDFVKFRPAYLVQLFAPAAELLVDLEGFLRHFLMGLLGPADERKVLPSRHSLVTVGVEPHP